jgi:hypothetical protein
LKTTHSSESSKWVQTSPGLADQRGSTARCKRRCSRTPDSWQCLSVRTQSFREPWPGRWAALRWLHVP